VEKVKAAKLEASSRRVPAQDRSRQRVERILDAAAKVFADVGYESATTEAIAELAETSVGSIYQFFPNKRALFHAITTRYHERCRAIFDDIVMNTRALPASWEALIDRAVDAFAGMNVEPGFRAIWKNWQVSADVFEAGDALNREFAHRIEGLLSAYAPRLPARKRPLVGTMVVEVMSALLLLSVRRERSMGPEIVAETKTLLRRYLAPYVVRWSTSRRRAGDKRGVTSSESQQVSRRRTTP
jgi:AcrR family transcriptional regulator